METNNYACKIARKILKKNNLSNISLENLVYLIEEQGYELIEFSPDTIKEVGIIASFHLELFAKSAKAFTYKNADLKYVFVRDDLSANEKLYALAHEEGHIACGHLEKINVSPDNIEDEYEANEFAHYLLNPSISQKIKTIIYEHKRISLVASAIILCIIIAIPVTIHFIKESSYYGEYYVTQSGEKYHEKDCIFIKNKNNFHRMTIDEFESGEYEPCQICLPESKKTKKGV